MNAATAASALSSVLDAVSTGIVQTDAEWTVLQVNASAERMLGLSRSELVGFALPACLPREAAARFERSGRWLRSDVVPCASGGWVLSIHDVTSLTVESGKRQEAEAALEANQEFLQAVLDNIDSGVVACDSAGMLRLFNNATRRFHGASEEPLPADEWQSRYDLYRPDGVTPLRTEEVPLYRAFSGEEVRRQEIVIAPRDGQRRSVLCSGRALTSRDGRKLGAVVAMQDVTHRKVTTGRLRHTLRLFRALFNHAPIPYHEVDREGLIRRVNVAELRLLERTRAEMIGRPVWEFVSNEQRETSRIAVAEKLAGKRELVPTEREYLTASGRKLPLEIHETLIRDASGAITGMRTALLDVTDRKQRLQAEMESAEIRSILERIGDAYMAFDTDWRYTYVNQKAAEFTRKPVSELIGRRLWDVFPDAVGTPFHGELQRCLRDQVVIEFESYFAPLAKWFSNSVYPSPSGVGVFYRDTTERVRTEQWLKHRTEELARKNTEMETFVYVASHDLQEPLRSIAGYASLLTRRYADRLDEDGREFLAYINHGSERMQRLIKDLLSLSRVNKEGIVHEEVKVAHVIDLVCGTLELALADNQANVIRRELPAIRFNETHLLQLLQNLVGNALKYRRDVALEIAVAAERRDSGWVISVSDNGAGFDMEFAEQVFRPFKRLHRREDGGTGIGLAICRKIVESRGGMIWVESKAGVGSTFYFTVPDALPDPQ